jgi:hypothetical protein
MRKWNQWICTLLCVFLLVPGNFVSAAQAESTETSFDALRLKWRDVITGGAAFDPADPGIAAQISSIEDTAQAAWDTLQTGDERVGCDCLWMDLKGTTLSGNNVVAYGRMRSMALAYVTEGSSLKGNAALRDAIVDALDWNYANRYNENTVRYDNWYHWEMSGPQNLMETVILMYDVLQPAQIDAYMRAVKAFSPDPNLTNGNVATGANRVEKSWVYMLRGIIVQDANEIALARDALSDTTRIPSSTNGLNNVFAYTVVAEADGMHEDGSFLQHGPHPYIGNYGTTFFQLVANAVYLLDGSAWAVTDPLAANIVNWIYDSFAPTLVDGGQMDMFRGRLISNAGIQSHVAGHRVIQGVITALSFVPPKDAAVFKQMVKQWVVGDTYRNFLAEVPIFYSTAARQIVDDPTILPYGHATMNKIYTQSDRVVHLRPDYAFGLSMSSSRVFRYESINGNNLHGWRMGDGVTYLYNGDIGHYDDDYWATTDMYRLPGITATNQTLNDRAGQSTKTPHSWVGGVSDGEFGTAGMQFTPYGTSLNGYKSWFMFDNEIVALGAGITSADDHPVETIIENRRLGEAGGNLLTVNGLAQPTALDGQTHTYSDISWANLQGTADHADIGYYFPSGGTINGLRETATGSWGAIQGPGVTETLTNNYQRLWLDHGSKPSEAAYQYAILPNLTPAETGQYAAVPQFDVLENSQQLQAVQEKSLNIVGANFWTDNPKTVTVGGQSWITNNAKSSVMTKKTGQSLVVSISDPTQSRVEPMNIEINQAAKGVITTDPRITVVQLAPTLKLSVDAGEAKGASLQVKLALDELPGDTIAPSKPAGLTATAISKSEIRLGWTASTDNSSVAGYKVYRNGSLVGTVLSPQFTDRGLLADTSYTYTVAAFDPAGSMSDSSVPVSATTLDVNVYLIRDDFNETLENAAPDGYTICLDGGTIGAANVPGNGNRSIKFTDTSGSKAVTATKPIGAQTDFVIADFKVMLPAVSSYHSWNLKGDGNVNAVSVMTSGSNLIYKNSSGGDSVLQPFTANRWYNIRILADPGTDRANIYVDGVAKAHGVRFRNAVSSLTAFTASTGESSSGTYYLDDVTVYPFTTWIEDTFDSEQPGSSPSGYDVQKNGGAVVIADRAEDGRRSMKLEDGSQDAAVSASQSFIASSNAVVEFDFLLPEYREGFAWSLLGDNGAAAVMLRTAGNRVVAVDYSGMETELQRFVPNKWNTARIVANGSKNKFSVYINGVEAAADLKMDQPIGGISRFQVSSAVEQTGVLFIDNVTVRPFEYLIDDDYNTETSATPSGYTLDARGGPITVSALPGSTERGLKFADTNNRASVATKTFFTQRGSIVSEFDIMLPELSTFHSWNLKDEAGTNGVTVMSSFIGNKHVFIYKNENGGDTVIQSYQPNTWYRFKIKADPVKQQFSLYINDELLVADAGFRFSVSNMAGFAASTATGGPGTFYMDNLKVYPAGFLNTKDELSTGTYVSVVDDGQFKEQTGNAQSPFSIYAKAWDPDGDPVTVSASVYGVEKTFVIQSPPLQMPDEPNVVLTWTGSELAEGIYSDIQVRSTDFYGRTAEALFTGKLIVDKTAPTLIVKLDPPVLKTPNHKKVTVTATVYAEDTGSGIANIELTSITSSDPDIGNGDGNHPDDIQNAQLGTDDRSFDLRAERSGQSLGRTYTVTYTARDRAGNITSATGTVIVTHDNGKKD